MSAIVKPAPRPVATLRHHSSALTTVDFAKIAAIDCVLSGDAAGEVALWNVATRRVIASWQPHACAAILKVQALDSSSSNSNSDRSRILTQGRDGSLSVWDASQLNCKPRRSAGGAQSNPLPGLLATLDTGSYNFCKCATVRWFQSRKTASSAQVNNGDKGESSEETTVPSVVIDQSEKGNATECTGIGGLLASHKSDFVISRGSNNRGNTTRSEDQEVLASAKSHESFNSPSNGSNSSGSGNSTSGSSNKRTPEWVATACSEMSTIQLWDLRDPRQPVLTVAPSDSTPKTGMLMCLDLVGCKSDTREDGSSDYPSSDNAEGTNSNASTSCIEDAASSFLGCSSLVVVAGYESGHVLVFDLCTGTQIGQQQVHQEPVLSVVVGPRSMSTRRSDTGATISHSDSNDIEGRASSNTEARLQVISAAADAALAVSVLDLNGARKNNALLGPASAHLPLGNDDKHPGAEALAVKHLTTDSSVKSNDDSTALLACGGWDRRVRLFEWQAPHRPIAVLKQHTAAVAALAWGPNGSLLASASRDGNIALWTL